MGLSDVVRMLVDSGVLSMFVSTWRSKSSDFRRYEAMGDAYMNALLGDALASIRGMTDAQRVLLHNFAKSNEALEIVYYEIGLNQYFSRALHGKAPGDTIEVIFAELYYALQVREFAAGLQLQEKLLERIIASGRLLRDRAHNAARNANLRKRATDQDRARDAKRKRDAYWGW